ncbi:TPM domain-containing protein [Capnocytophaga sp.]|uniref:TPM domain-containing protein n=1 Tax=Capnocytophaga sp. TaxID=44737 RepID=UPI0026DBBA5A|nr:TPM domain-containing protein [Capnocytophaga sp.]MDO5105898.1 TPM domain-containing protein [Capnocytophaga sp.]
MPVNQFLTSEQEQAIVEAIRQAEKRTSGEIRVHLENTSTTDPYERAMEVFQKLEMHQTANRNGVLFYFAVDDRSFVIFGDEGINQVVPPDFWESTKNEMLHHFQKAEFHNGIIAGILKAGEALKVYFPYQSGNDSNELPDEISKGNI